MKTIFSKYYIRVCPNAQSQQMEDRLSGIDEYCNEDTPNITNLTRWSFKLKVDEQFRDEFVSIFQNIDMRFQADAETELSLLACMCLIKLLENNDFNTAISLSVLCLSKYGIDILVPELILRANKCFQTKASQLRESAHTIKSIKTTHSDNFLKEITSSSSLDTNKISLLSNSIQELSKCVGDINANQKKLQSEYKILKEESNILSWVIGSWSNELNKSITKSTTQLEISLIIAKELADLVKVLPGPFPFDAILHKMLSNGKHDGKSYSFVKIIDAIDNQYKQSILHNYAVNNNSQVCTPILMGIKCAIDANVPDIWKNAASNILSFNIEKVENTLFDWAKLMYLECLLVKLEGCE